MKTVEISEIVTLLENYGKNEQPLIIIRNGQPVAVLLSVEDADIESLSLTLNPKFIDIIEQSRQHQKQEGRFFLEDINFCT